jgi:cation diffusion facilitator CzcD-associated flavoprotein CzcO
MPKNMTLKSDGFASNLSAPSTGSTLKAYCATHGLPYADQGLPISLDTFLAYADSFRQRFVAELEQVNVVSLERDTDEFVLTLETGERVKARNAVIAVGITWFAYTPPVLSALPTNAVSHSFHHRDGEVFKGREVAIIGRGASAIDLASLLDESGVSVRILARAPTIAYNLVPDPDAETLFQRLQRPASGIGRGWRSYFCAEAPLLFYRLPERLKARAIRSHMHPAAGWFMREKVEGRIPMTLGREISKASANQGRVTLVLTDRSGREEMLACDHVIAATGYRPDMRRMPFLAPDLCARMAPSGGRPILSDSFESSVQGLFVVGPAATHSFGPLMRFMMGAEFAAPRVAARLERKFRGSSKQRAA